MLPRPRLIRPLLRHAVPLLRRRNATVHPPPNAVVHPRIGGVPFIERRSDRPLPDPMASRRVNMLMVPAFLLAVGAACLVIFNYQKTNSSVVASTLYALRTHPGARELLGDEIQFKRHLPIIRGKIDQLHGEIDISYDVRGTKGEGVMRFRSTRKTRMDLFDTEVWYLETKDGRKLVLLEGAPSLPKSE